MTVTAHVYYVICTFTCGYQMVGSDHHKLVCKKDAIICFFRFEAIDLYIFPDFKALK
jgi:hypothetical protein